MATGEKPQQDILLAEALLMARSFERATELLVQPLAGRFDVDHLRSVHRYLLQDTPPELAEAYRPGTFRDEHPPDGLYSKIRIYEAAPIRNLSVYSHMTQSDQVELQQALARAHPERLLGETLNGARRAVSRLYEEVDYIHPFKEANSRTLRIYTSMVADKLGHQLDWAGVGATTLGRDTLYMSRDTSLLDRGLRNARSEHHLRTITQSRALLRGAPRLETLLDAFMEPHSSHAFRTQPKARALAQFPDLAQAYAVARSVFVDMVGGKGSAHGASLPPEERLRIASVVRNVTADFIKTGRTFSPQLDAARLQLDQFLTQQNKIMERGWKARGQDGPER